MSVSCAAPSSIPMPSLRSQRAEHTNRNRIQHIVALAGREWPTEQANISVMNGNIDAIEQAMGKEGMTTM